MSRIARRRLVFEGRIHMSALLMSDTPLGHQTILSLWQWGTVVHRVGSELLVRFTDSRECDADAMRGTPLIDCDGVLVGVPLRGRELSALNAARGQLIVARAGRITVLTPTPGEVDVSEWLSIPELKVIEPPPPPALPAIVVAPVLAERPIELRPDAASLSSETSQLLSEALHPNQPLWRRWVTSALRWLRGRTNQQRALPENTAQARPSLLARFDQWINRLIANTRLERWMDRLNRTYVDRLLKMFEREALDEALKHAVPLSRKAAEPGTPPSRLPLFSARSNLGLSLGGLGGGGPAGVLPAGAYETLRERYRKAAEKLEGAGRVDEAAFVLADLLDAPMEAIALFERHGHFEKAARLAEARKLSPELSVRLWVLADELPRAIAIARRHRVFGPAVALLDKGHPKEALTLRLEWANWLASSGDFAGAVAAILPVPQALQVLPGPRRLALQWAELGIEAGGHQRPALLIQRISLDPESAAPFAAQALQILSDTTETGADERSSLGAALANTSVGPAPRNVVGADLLKPLVRTAIRALVRDQATLGTAQGVLSKLLALDDGPLRTDVPAIAPGVRAAQPLPTRFERDSAALIPHDAICLANGGLLVALGESGIALVRADGTVTWRAQIPAFSFIASDEGPLVLALSPQEDVTTISKISLAQKTATRWAELPLTCASSTFRDGIWFIANGSRVLGIDVLAEKPVSLWELHSPLQAPVKAMEASATHVHVLVQGYELSRLSWKLPSFDSDLATPIVPLAGTDALAVSASGFLMVGRGANAEPLAAVSGSGGSVAQHVLPGTLTGVPSCGGEFHVVPLHWRGEPADQVDVLLRPSERRFSFGKATRARTRLHDGKLVICCDNGHIVSFDVSSGRLLQDVTVKPS